MCFFYFQLSGKEAPDIHCRDSVGNTPLHCATYRGQKQCVIKLLKSGASPSVKNNSGMSHVPFSFHFFIPSLKRHASQCVEGTITTTDCRPDCLGPGPD